MRSNACADEAGATHMTEIIIGALAVFGVSALLSTYDGPFEILLTLRKYAIGLDCTVCTSEIGRASCRERV